MSERIEPGAEAAHRDDLARDVAQLWVDNRYRIDNFPPDLEAALERLAGAYGLETVLEAEA